MEFGIPDDVEQSLWVNIVDSKHMPWCDNRCGCHTSGQYEDTDGSVSLVCFTAWLIAVQVYLPQHNVD